MRPAVCQGQLGRSRKEAASTFNVTILLMDLWSQFPSVASSGKATEPVTGRGSSFRSMCERNSVVYFKFAPISGQAVHNKVAGILTFALVLYICKRKLHSSRWFLVFILSWNCFVCLFSLRVIIILVLSHTSRYWVTQVTQVSRNPKCGCQM